MHYRTRIASSTHQRVAHDMLDEAVADRDLALQKFEEKFIVKKPENTMPGRPEHLVIGKMIIFLGTDGAGEKPAPWVAKVVAIDGTDVRVEWYHSANDKLRGKWRPVKKRVRRCTNTHIKTSRLF